MTAQENRFRSSGRKALGKPKGRGVEPTDLEWLDQLLGGDALARDELIEHLHAIQDAEGCLPMARLVALAHRHRIPMAEVYEVATFYAHFDVVGDDHCARSRHRRHRAGIARAVHGPLSVRAGGGSGSPPRR